jgi:hypothetical protein
MKRLAFVALVAAGCSSGSNNGNIIDPGPPPSNGLQIILPVQTQIQPGTDNEICTWTNVTVSQDTFIKSAQGFQGPAGHHIVVYKTKDYQPPGTTRDCSNDDLATVRFVAGLGGEGEQVPAPGDLAYSIENGYQIVINHHYINATSKPVDSQSAVNLYFPDPGSTFTKVGAVAIVDTGFKLDQGQVGLDIKCAMKDPMKLWFGIPHMHAYGYNITVDHVPVNGSSERLFDTAWNPSLTFHPPQLTWDPTQPKLFAKGDQVNVHCDWNNDSGGPLTFGIEMCVFFAQTVDDTNLGDWACDAGQWTTF